jgi:DeoR/GlpR family transcriptional regulator of sugar metabolism
MLAIQRLGTTLALLGQQKAMRVEDLAEQMSISLSTVRRDLDELERQGLVRRVHGGAVLIGGGGAPDVPEPPPSDREVEHRHDKRAIAWAALKLLQPASTVMVSGGTTTAALVPLLHQIPELTVVTNSLDVAYRLAADEVDVIVLGGALRRPELSLLGHMVDVCLEDIQVDHAVMGAYGLNARSGVLGASGQESGTDRSLARCADRLTILADASKFTRRSPHRIAPTEQLTDLVSGSDAPTDEVAEFRAKGVTVHLVDILPMT